MTGATDDGRLALEVLDVHVHPQKMRTKIDGVLLVRVLRCDVGFVDDVCMCGTAAACCVVHSTHDHIGDAYLLTSKLKWKEYYLIEL